MNEMKSIPYASVVGSIMYAQVYTRPNLAFVTGLLGRFQSDPGINTAKSLRKSYGTCKGLSTTC
jgi:hypothetical protein